MSQPTFPENPNITREDAINQILSSIAMEELGLSHIINAEGEKLQYILGTIPGVDSPAATIDEVLKANDSVQKLLETAGRNQMFLSDKMSNALSASTMDGPQGPQGLQGPAGPTGPQGAEGIAGTIAGSYPTAADIQSSAPTGDPSKFYLAQDTGHLWSWDAANNKWMDLGSIQGPAGATGAQGATGASGALDPNTTLFTVIGPNNTPINVTPGDKMTFRTNTPDVISIDVSAGSTIVTIDSLLGGGTGAGSTDDGNKTGTLDPNTTDNGSAIVNFANGIVDWANPLTWPISATAVEFPDISGFTGPLQTIISAINGILTVPVVGPMISGVVNGILNNIPIPGTQYKMSLDTTKGLPALLNSLDAQATASGATGTAGLAEIKNYIGHANVGVVPQIVGVETPVLDLVAGPPYPVILARGGTITAFAAEFDTLLSLDLSIAVGGANPIYSTVAKIAAFLTDTLTNAFGALEGVSNALDSVLTDAFGAIEAPLQAIVNVVSKVPLVGQAVNLQMPNVGTIIGTGLTDFINTIQTQLGKMTDFLDTKATDTTANANFFATLWHLPNTGLNAVDTNSPNIAVDTPATIDSGSTWIKVTEINLGPLHLADLAPVSNLSSVVGGLAGSVKNLLAFNTEQADGQTTPTGQFLAGITEESVAYDDTLNYTMGPAPLAYKVNPGDYLMVGFETRLGQSVGVFTGVAAPNAIASVAIS